MQETVTAAPEEEATPEPQGPAPRPMFTIYSVQPGDTVSGLAARFGLQPESIMWNNVEVNDADFLELGQQLRIPAADGIIHEVKLNETLSDIAARYDADLESIEDFASNGVTDPDNVYETQLVFVPGGVRPAPPPVVEEPVAAAAGDSTADGSDAVPAAPSVPVDSGPVAASAGFIWPATGPISSYMDASHPLGIDIDQFNSPNAPVYAAASGVVTFAGGSTCCSYGLYVVIAHPDGFETLYAHLGTISVVQGQTVSQGEVIGSVGCTGYCTGNHLHLEFHYNGSLVNPLAYLP